MILQALARFYQRKAADSESGIAPLGFEWKEIPFVIVIDKHGAFVTLEDTRTPEGKKKRAKSFLVPQGAKKAAGVRANLLWDSVEYCVGANPRGRDDIAARTAAFQAELASRLPARHSDARVEALLTFLENCPDAAVAKSSSVAALWAEALDSNANVTFRISGDDSPTLCEAFHAHLVGGQGAQAAGDESGLCLVSGLIGPVARIHPSLKGVRDAQSSGASLVSFNQTSFVSYGKSQNFNAPISEKATFEYTTALNSLLGKDSKNKVQVGDATTVFWSERRTGLETSFSAFFAMPPKDDPDRDVVAVRALYTSLDTGALEFSSPTKFYVLGLSPNAARVSVRFWHQGTVADFSHRIRQHFDDLEIVRSPSDSGRYSLFWLLVEISPERKVDNMPPNLAGSITRAVLDGAPYPATLLQQAIRRTRAEQEVTRMRAAILKACLNRFQRTHATQEREIKVALDIENMNPGYRLGRLFAVLEKIQEDASPGLNATIRDRFYGAASANPVTVFPQLLKLKNHHLKKIDNPRFVGAHERRLGEIFAGLPASMPAHLRMEDQARFAIGYYHQRQALFAKSVGEPPTGSPPTDSAQN